MTTSPQKVVNAKRRVPEVLRIPLSMRNLAEGVEHLWSQAGATGGNRSQMAPPRKRLKQADRQPVATHGNRFGAHGKEGVDGSSPSEGSAKAPLAGLSGSRSLGGGALLGPCGAGSGA